MASRCAVFAVASVTWVVRLLSGGAVTGHIANLPPGEYALVVYHDENGNGRLDRNFIGIPREPLGFSNRHWPQGPPSFTRAAFLIEEGETKTLDIMLQLASRMCSVVSAQLPGSSKAGARR